MNLVLEAPAGSVTVPASTLLAIAQAAAEQVDGVHVLRRRSVELDPPALRLALSVRRGEPMLELAQAAQERVAAALATMCDLDARVELTVAEWA